MKGEREKLLHIEDVLSKRVVGQQDAIVVRYLLLSIQYRISLYDLFLFLFLFT
jgi:hypothetical protein